MTIQGADVAQLRKTGRSMQQAGLRLQAQARAVTQALATAPWSGSDAQRYRDEWEGRHRAVLLAAAAAIGEAARTLQRNADEQEHASGESSGGDASEISGAVSVAGLARLLGKQVEGGLDASVGGLRLDAEGEATLLDGDSTVQKPGWVTDPETGERRFRLLGLDEELYLVKGKGSGTLTWQGQDLASGDGTAFLGLARHVESSIGRDGLRMDGDGFLGAQFGLTGVKTPFALGTLGASAAVGAFTSARLRADRHGVDAEAEAYLGAKVGASTRIDGPGIDLTASAHGRAGAGESGSFHLTHHGGKWQVGTGTGGAVGLGGDAALNAEIDPGEIARNVHHLADEAGKQAKKYGDHAVAVVRSIG